MRCRHEAVHVRCQRHAARPLGPRVGLQRLRAGQARRARQRATLVAHVTGALIARAQQGRTTRSRFSRHAPAACAWCRRSGTRAWSLAGTRRHPAPPTGSCRSRTPPGSAAASRPRTCVACEREGGRRAAAWEFAKAILRRLQLRVRLRARRDGREHPPHPSKSYDAPAGSSARYSSSMTATSPASVRSPACLPASAQQAACMMHAGSSRNSLVPPQLTCGRCARECVRAAAPWAVRREGSRGGRAGAAGASAVQRCSIGCPSETRHSALAWVVVCPAPAHPVVDARRSEVREAANLWGAAVTSLRRQASAAGVVP